VRTVTWVINLEATCESTETHSFELVLCLLKTLAANIMTRMIYTLKENPVVEQNTLFSCPTLYMFYLEIINPEKLPRLPALPPATGCKAHFDPSPTTKKFKGVCLGTLDPDLQSTARELFLHARC